MKKKVLCILLMLTLVLTACGRLGTPAESAPESQAMESEAPAETESPTPTEAASETPTETPKETEAPPEETGPSAEEIAMYTAYLSVLATEKSGIENYDWQMTYTGNADDPWDTTTNKGHIALADVYGDEKPELIFVAAPRNEQGYAYAGTLTILTYEDEAVRMVYSDRLDVLAGGGVYYALLQREGEKTPILYISYLEEFTYSYLREFAETDEGMLEVQEAMSEGYGPDETYENMVRETQIDGADVPEEEYDALLAEKLDAASGVLMYSGFNDEKIMERIEGLPLLAMTYEEAVAALKELGAEETEDLSNLSAVFANVPHDYFFTSGAGGWATSLHLNDDGSFTASYSDSDMGDSSEEYPNGTVYTCECTGRFDQLEWINDHCFGMKLTELSMEHPEGETWIEDGIRYVGSTPYGISSSGTADGQTFMIYLAGIDTEVLPAEYLEWVGMASATDYTAEVVMPISGLYNQADQTGFVAEETPE